MCSKFFAAAHVLRKAMEVNVTCDVQIDFNPLPDALRWDPRCDAFDEGDSVTSTHRSVHSRIDKETQIAHKKRKELVDRVSCLLPTHVAVLEYERSQLLFLFVMQVKGAEVPDDESIFSRSVDSTSTSKVENDFADINSITSASVDYSKFSGDLNVYSDKDREREENLYGLKESRSSIISRRLARRTLRKKSSTNTSDAPVKSHNLMVIH